MIKNLPEGDTAEMAMSALDRMRRLKDRTDRETGTKHPVRWWKNEETGELMIYTKGEYAKELIAFINSL